MSDRSIFIGATGQDVGKTTLCLGIIAGLKKRYSRIGFIKPVGQQHVTVEPGVIVDKDAYLFKKYFNIESGWEQMSPVIIPSGFTREFLDGAVSESSLLKKIETGYHSIRSQHDYTVVEGTGHVGVGSIVELSNAKVASLLGLDMVIIASGGLGSAFDELAMNIALCKQHRVNVRGVILNRVYDDKREMISEYFPKALKRWNIPLLGCVPYDSFLSKPSIQDFEALFNTTLLSGAQHHFRHFESVRLSAGSVDTYKKEMIPNELIITPASREEIIRATLDKHREVFASEGKDFRGGMILTGRHPPSEAIIEEIRSVDIPILYAPICSYDAMKKITSFIAKIRLEDVLKIEKAIALVEHHIDFDLLCKPSSCSAVIN